ncbi:hypothetical protein L6452_31505 [Arctium lappa]|uniref:Uncharacterized protein n=1 Tax=Arctium lappa TaxID=4217 RepID=A0ACB8Z297_ARCLA|nr:hypothetical protein L6452_31505 [Arctium lappa]
MLSSIFCGSSLLPNLVLQPKIKLTRLSPSEPMLRLYCRGSIFSDRNISRRITDAKDASPAFLLAVSVIQGCSQALQLFVCRFLNYFLKSKLVELQEAEQKPLKESERLEKEIVEVQEMKITTILHNFHS